MLMLKLISAPNLPSEQTIWIRGTDATDNSISARIDRRRIIDMLKNARRFTKHVDLRGNIVSGSPNHPTKDAILGNLGWTICTIPRNVGAIATQSNKAFTHRFRNRCATRKLIVVNRIDRRARSERVEKHRGG